MLIALSIAFLCLCFLVLWTWLLCRTLANEEDYFWIIVLAVMPPVGVPLYLVNFFILGDKQRGLTKMKGNWTTGRRIRDLETELRDGDTIGRRAELASLYAELGEYERALEHLRPAIDHDPESLRLQHLAAVCLEETGRLEAAAVPLRFILEEDPNFMQGEAELRLALILERLGQQAEAAAHYQSLARRSTRPEMVFHVARFFWNSDRQGEMRGLLQKTVDSYAKEPGMNAARDRPWLRRSKELLGGKPPSEIR